MFGEIKFDNEINSRGISTKVGVSGRRNSLHFGDNDKESTWEDKGVIETGLLLRTENPEVVGRVGVTPNGGGDKGAPGTNGTTGLCW